MKEVYLYLWPGRRKILAADEREFKDPVWGYQAKAKAWWIVRAETADHARSLVKAGLVSDGVGPGIVDSNVIPSLVQARMERIAAAEKAKFTEAEGPRAGLPKHEMPSDMPPQLFTSPITWGTTAPYWMGEPLGTRYGFADIPAVEVPVISTESALRSGALVPIARQKALGLADVMGWSLKFVPLQYEDKRRRKFTDQYGQKRMGRGAKIRFEIIGGLTFEQKMALR